MKEIYTVVLSALLVAACSPDPGSVPKIAESQRNALEKAKEVQATVNQSAEEQRQQIDGQSQ